MNANVYFLILVVLIVVLIIKDLNVVGMAEEKVE
jgi:hypothetical protein